MSSQPTLLTCAILTLCAGCSGERTLSLEALNPEPLRISRSDDADESPAVAASDTGFLVAWRRGQTESSGGGLFGVLLDDEGQLAGSAHKLADFGLGAHDQAPAPALASNGEQFLVTSQGGNVDGRVVDAEGTPAKSAVSLGAAAPAEQDRPAVAWGANRYLVAWADADRIRATRLAADGSVIGEPLELSRTDQGANQPAVAFGGDDFFVVWGTPSGDGIYGARVSPDGEVIDKEPITVIAGGRNARLPAVAHDGGDGYLVVWRGQGRTEKLWGIYGARVSSAGEVLDQDNQAIVVSESWRDRPALAHGNGAYLVLWEALRDTGLNIYGTLVATDHKIVAPTPAMVSDSPARAAAPAVAFGQRAFLAVWEDGRSGSGDIYGALLAP